MPLQVTGLTLSTSADLGTITVQIGPLGYEIPTSELFRREFDVQTLKDSLRLAFLIGGYGEPDSIEFVAAVNQSLGGLEGPDQRWFVARITPAGGDMYNVAFADRLDVAPGSVEISRNDLTTDYQDMRVVIANLRPWLRIEGATSLEGLTEAVKARLAAHIFWY